MFIEKIVIKQQQKFFEYMINEIANIKDIDLRVKLAAKLAYFAVYNHTGYYYSAKLEKIFTDYAETINVKINNSFNPNTFLHVLTKAFVFGGHTRVVEKWIEQAPDSQIHSVICLNQQEFEIPDRLKKAVEDKKGKLFILECSNLKDRALKLRKIASDFEYIILHIHMEDSTALVAFGTETFKRPVIFFNHADHMFWLGKSIIDILAVLREYSDNITTCKRQISDSFMLGVPIDFKHKPLIDKQQAKRNLKIDVNKKLIISVGNASKFHPIGRKNFLKILSNIINENDNIQIIIIGPDKKDKLWKKAYVKSKGIISTIGEIDYNNGYFDYINAADLVIDSWPIGGGTVMLDAINFNTPVLSLKNPLGQFDYLTISCAYCKTEDELYKKIKLVLNNEKFKEDLLNEVKTNLDKEHSLKNWRKKIETLVQMTPKIHTVKNISNEKENKDIDEASVILNYVYNKDFWLKALFKINFYYLKYFIFKLLNKL